MASPVRIDYFLDPCYAASWALLPALAPLLQELGPEVSMRVRTLPLTDGAAQASSKATNDCLPIPTEAWAGGPKACSLPVSRAAKAAAALGGTEAEARFLLALSPLLLQQAGTPYDTELFMRAVNVAGIDPVAFQQQLDDPALDRQIEADLAAGRDAGVRCMPAAVISSGPRGRVLIEGLHDVGLFRQVLLALRDEQRSRTAGAGVVATPIMPEIAQVMPDEAPTG